jgi:hypothetical protein
MSGHREPDLMVRSLLLRHSGHHADGSNRENIRALRVLWLFVTTNKRPHQAISNEWFDLSKARESGEANLNSFQHHNETFEELRRLPKNLWRKEILNAMRLTVSGYPRGYKATTIFAAGFGWSSDNCSLVICHSPLDYATGTAPFNTCTICLSFLPLSSLIIGAGWHVCTGGNSLLPRGECARALNYVKATTCRLYCRRHHRQAGRDRRAMRCHRDRRPYRCSLRSFGRSCSP